MRPKLGLTRIGPHRFRLRVFAARSMVGKFGLVQRWNARGHVWVSVRRLYLRTTFAGVSPTVVSQASFRFRGAKIRVFMPLGQVAPGYVAGVSPALRA